MRKPAVLTAFVLVCGSVHFTTAADIQWTGTVSDRFAEPRNWEGGVIPRPDDSAIIFQQNPNFILQIAEGDAITVDRFQVGLRDGQLDGQPGMHDLKMVGGELVTNELKFEWDDDEISLFILAAVTARAHQVTFEGTAMGRGVVAVEGGVLHIGTGGIRVANGQVPASVVLGMNGGALRVPGRVMDVTELFDDVRFRSVFESCGVGVGAFLHAFDPLLNVTDVTTVAGLAPGDADQDLDFDQNDLLQVLKAGKYLAGQPATWGEGDWDGAPASDGVPGSPPPGNGFFDHLDVVAALQHAAYLTGPYCILGPRGDPGDVKVSIGYNSTSGELWVDASNAAQLSSIRIESSAGVFTGHPAQNLGGSFDSDSDTNIFKATFGSSFGSLSFGNVAQIGLPEQFVLYDLTIMGSLVDGGDFPDVELIYVPEPPGVILLVLGIATIAACRYRASGVGNGESE